MYHRLWDGVYLEKWNHRELVIVAHELNYMSYYNISISMTSDYRYMPNSSSISLCILSMILSNSSCGGGW